VAGHSKKGSLVSKFKDKDPKNFKNDFQLKIGLLKLYLGLHRDYFDLMVWTTLIIGHFTIDYQLVSLKLRTKLRTY